ncbi:MAG TPA: Uma2 family endonuclease [Saprospiraceae bacterium]|nr:Uma2 family endonuclease [Saprospiraceae bacterium]HMP23989.1 Uma2 family endonuclease [Saprospiraceae bacterium]
METAQVQSEYEIERGKPAPSRNHAYIQSRIIKLLDRKYADSYEGISELSLLVEGKERVPDILIYKNFEFRPGNDEVKVSEMPLAVVEILSPKQNLGDLIAKSYLYFEAGVKSYWLVLPDLTTIYIFSAPNEYEAFVKKGILKDAQLDIELNLEDIFK